MQDIFVIGILIDLHYQVPVSDNKQAVHIVLKLLNLQQHGRQQGRQTHEDRDVRLQSGVRFHKHYLNSRRTGLFGLMNCLISLKERKISLGPKA